MQVLEIQLTRWPYHNYIGHKLLVFRDNGNQMVTTIYVDRAYLPPRLCVLVFSPLCAVLCWVLWLGKNGKRPGYQGSKRQNPSAYLNYNKSLHGNAPKSYEMNKSITRNIKIKSSLPSPPPALPPPLGFLLDFSEVQLFPVFQSRD